MDLYVPFNAVKPATISYNGTASATVTASTFTFTPFPLGTAAANRKVIIGVVYNSATAVNSVTVGGTSATQIASNGACSFWVLDVPTGTTATIVVTMASAIVGCAIAGWAAYGLRTSTAVGSGSATATATVHTLDATAFQGGVVVGVSAQTTAVLSTTTWSGLSMDQAAVGIGFGVGQSVSAASAQVTAGGSPRAMSVTWTVSNPTRSLAAALF